MFVRAARSLQHAHKCTHRYTNACMRASTLIYRAQLHAHSAYAQMHTAQTHTCNGTSARSTDGHPSAHSTRQGHPEYHPAASSSTNAGSAGAELMVPKGLGEQLLPPCYCVVGTRRPSGCCPQHLLARLPNPESWEHPCAAVPCSVSRNCKSLPTHCSSCKLHGACTLTPRTRASTQKGAKWKGCMRSWEGAQPAPRNQRDAPQHRARQVKWRKEGGRRGFLRWLHLFFHYEVPKWALVAAGCSSIHLHGWMPAPRCPAEQHRARCPHAQSSAISHNRGWSSTTQICACSSQLQCWDPSSKKESREQSPSERNQLRLRAVLGHEEGSAVFPTPSPRAFCSPTTCPRPQRVPAG